MAQYDQLGRSDYIPTDDLPQKVLGWGHEALQEGDQYLRSQKGYGRANEMRLMILGDDKPFRPGELSTTSDNEIGRLFSLTSAELTDWEPYWQYSTVNPKFETNARIQSNYLNWWFPRFGERPTETIVKDCLISGASVGAIVWDRNKQEIALQYRNAHDVLPVRPDSLTSDSYQGCLCVIDRRERPVHYVQNLFPHAAALIKPDRDASISSMLATAGSKVFGKSPLQIAQQIAKAPVAKLGAMPVVDLYYMYVDDRSVNEDSHPVEMGDWGYAADGSGRRISLNDWSYIVEPGEPLYPIKRLIIFTKNVLLYDGPSIYWHGMFPFVKCVLETVPDTWFGRSPLWPCIPLQHSLNRLYRAVDDHVQKVLAPGKMAPKIGVAASELRNYKTNMPNQSIRYGPAGKPETIPVPDLDGLVERHMDRILMRMGMHASVTQAALMATLGGVGQGGVGQVPEATSLDKILGSFSPQIRAWSRSLESFQRESGVMFSYDVAQFTPPGKRITILGEDAQTPEDYDIDPDSLVPAYVASDYLPNGQLKPDAHRDPRPRMQRALDHMPQFSLIIKPSSMLQTAKVQDRLIKITMRQKGDLDLWSAQKAAGIDNIGPEPPGNVFQRTVQEKMLAAGIPPPGVGGPPSAPPSGGSGDGGPGPDTKGPVGPHPGPGRPHTNQVPPHQRPDGRIETTK